MSGLLYYLPGQNHATLPTIGQQGLAYAFEADCTPRTGKGPDGGEGVILGDSTRCPEIGYYPTRQTWLAIPGHPKAAWVGRFTDGPVTPDDLLRAETLPGHWIRLGDGQDWLVPVARGMAEQDDGLAWYRALPHRNVLDAEGNWIIGEVVERYAGLWEIATRWWDAVMGGMADGNREAELQTIRFDFQELHTAAVTVLAANYRVAAAEASLLGLFEDGTAERILQALIDFPTIDAWLKKKQSEENARENSAAGG